MNATATVQPYLVFGGRLDDALAFYQRAVGAEVEMLMRFNESPDPLPAGMLAPGFETKIMHAAFRIGASQVLACDGTGHEPPLTGVSLAITVDSESEVDRLFDALVVGGKVLMPPAKTFWSPRFGMLTDRFGLGWMLMVAGEA